MPRIANLFFSCVLGLAAAVIFVFLSPAALRDDSHTIRDVSAQLARPTGTMRRPSLVNQPIAPEPLTAATTTFPVIIRKPSGAPVIKLAGVDPQGRSGSVACSTCHAVRKPNLENVSSATLDEFHQGLPFQHGNLACYACHNPQDSASLRLADGSAVLYENVIALCSQCHSSQATAFAHGAHGGMYGHWDLTQGPQMKNNCIDCHDPHAPSFPHMIVVFKPQDRFNVPAADAHEGTELHDAH